MPRYIDAEPYDKTLEQREKALWEIDALPVADAVRQCRALLAKQDTVDAVEVVRCKNCAFCYYNSSSETSKCVSQNGMYRTVKPDDFCSYGERVRV